MKGGRKKHSLPGPLLGSGTAHVTILPLLLLFLFLPFNTTTTTTTTINKEQTHRSVQRSCLVTHLTTSSDDDAIFSLLFFDFFFTLSGSSSPLLSADILEALNHVIFECASLSLCCKKTFYISVATLWTFVVVQQSKLFLHRSTIFLHFGGHYFGVYRTNTDLKLTNSRWRLLIVFDFIKRSSF